MPRWAFPSQIRQSQTMEQCRDFHSIYSHLLFIHHTNHTPLSAWRKQGIILESQRGRHKCSGMEAAGLLSITRLQLENKQSYLCHCAHPTLKCCWLLWRCLGGKPSLGPSVSWVIHTKDNLGGAEEMSCCRLLPSPWLINKSVACKSCYTDFSTGINACWSLKDAWPVFRPYVPQGSTIFLSLVLFLWFPPNKCPLSMRVEHAAFPGHLGCSARRSSIPLMVGGLLKAFSESLRMLRVQVWVYLGLSKHKWVTCQTTLPVSWEICMQV